MGQGKLSDQDYQLQIKSGLATNINIKATKLLALEGEPYWTTDTDKLYVFDGNNNIRVHGLDLAVMFEDNIISLADEIVYL